MRRATMTGRRLLAALAALTAVALGPAPAALAVPAPDDPAIAITSAGVRGDRVDLVVTGVRLPAGAVLRSAGTQVSIDGVPVRIDAASPGAGTPTATSRAAVVVLDTSGSMAGAKLAAARQVAAGYARALPADVRVGLVSAAQPARLLLRPTTDRARLAAALAALTAHGGTALYDGVLAATAALPAATATSTQRLVVLTDGADTASAGNLAAATGAVRRGRVGVDVVAFQVAAADRGPLVGLAGAGGGAVRTASDARELAGAFDAAARTISATLPLSVRLPSGQVGGTARVLVTVSVAGNWLSASRDVPLPGTAATPTPTAARPAATLTVTPLTAGWSWQLWLFVLAVFAALVCLGALALAGSGGSAHRGRVNQIERYRQAGGDPGAGPAAGPGGGRVAGPGGGRAGGLLGAPEQSRNRAVRAALAAASALARYRGLTERVGAQLDRAGVTIRVQEWLVLRACAGVVVAAAVGLLSHSALIGILTGPVVALLGGYGYLALRTSRRRAAFAEQLPDVLQLLASSLRSGFSLPQALEGIAREGGQPASGEFSRALGEARLGAPLEAALESVADRMGSRDLSWVVLAIRIQRRTGGNLAEVLLNTVRTMRERARIRRQVRALSAEGRISAYILVGLPLALAAWLFVVRRDYLRPLYTEPLGLAMLGGAGVLLVVGGFWMSRLIKVEV
jgi:tight adherence protein B